MALAALVALSLCAGSRPRDGAPDEPISWTPTRGAAHAAGHFELPVFSLPTGDLLWAGLALIAGIGLLRLAARRSRCRVIALGLSLALGVFTLESAVHSVHHLAEPETAATCPVLSGSQHLSWGEAQAAAADAPPLRVAPAPLPRRPKTPRSR